MRLGRLAWVLGACWLVAGCGARTSEDDLLGYGISGGPSVGGEGSGGFGVGGAADGGSFTGGAPFVGGSAGGPSGPCCVASIEPGCEDGSVYQCVCSFDPFCCDQAWDSTCVDEATTQCSLECGGAPAGGAGGGGGATGGGGGIGGGIGTGGMGAGGSGGTFGGDCCAPHGGVGCGVPSIMDCVCDADPYCCATSWDQICANESVDLCGASCMSGTGGGGIGGNGSGGNGAGGSGGQPSGGSPGTGGQGTGGGNAGQCDIVFPDACSNCLCNDCFDPLDACLDDFGCLAIYSCVYRTGCTGTDCLSPDTCGNTFDAFGGVTGPSAQTALGLIACAVVEGCPCD